MYFEDLASFISMEGHGPYVWSAYAIGMLVLAWNVLAPLRARSRVLAQLQRQERRQQHTTTVKGSERTQQPQNSQRKQPAIMETEGEQQ